MEAFSRKACMKILNLVWAPCDTGLRRSLREGIRPGKQCALEIRRSVFSTIVSYILYVRTANKLGKAFRLFTVTGGTEVINYN